MTIYNLMSLPDEPEDLDPLERRVAELEVAVRTLVDRDVEGAPQVVDDIEGFYVPDDDTTVLRLIDATESVHTLGAELDDLADKHGVVLELIEEIRAIIKPSTSKLANSLRDAIERWAAPVVEPVVEDLAERGRQLVGEREVLITQGVDPAALAERGRQLASERKDLIAQGVDPAVLAVPIYAAGPPAHDAPVEEWRAHARALGYTGADVDKANRSQIRTMLGIEQPVEP